MDTRPLSPLRASLRLDPIASMAASPVASRAARRAPARPKIRIKVAFVGEIRKNRTRRAKRAAAKFYGWGFAYDPKSE
eukprot:4621690-Prymnesium_polylepis.1